MTRITLQELVEVMKSEFKTYDVCVVCTLVTGVRTITGYVLSQDRETFERIATDILDGWSMSIDPCYNKVDSMPHAKDMTYAFFYEPDDEVPNGVVYLNIGHVNPFDQ